jgi:hypothetical protein
MRPLRRFHMSTHADPSKDEYLKLEEKLGAAEDELAANLAETDKALDTAVKKGKEDVKAAGAKLKRKAAARSRKRDPDGLRNYTLEARAGRSDLTALPELVRAQSLSHR